MCENESMRKVLVVIDMQNDFIDGSLGSQDAQAIVFSVVDEINSWDGDIVYTLDTHYCNYLATNEGLHLPIPHCIENTEGHQLNSKIAEAIFNKCPNAFGFEKHTFSSITLAQWIYHKYDFVTIVGLCTDICVISNALCIKAFNPEAEIAVVANCCAGTILEKHKAALDVMQSCQITII